MRAAEGGDDAAGDAFGCTKGMTGVSFDAAPGFGSKPRAATRGSAGTTFG
jgi:hypothetical protein